MPLGTFRFKLQRCFITSWARAKNVQNRSLQSTSRDSLKVYLSNVLARHLKIVSMMEKILQVEKDNYWIVKIYSTPPALCLIPYTQTLVLGARFIQDTFSSCTFKSIHIRSKRCRYYDRCEQYHCKRSRFSWLILRQLRRQSLNELKEFGQLQQITTVNQTDSIWFNCSNEPADLLKHRFGRIISEDWWYVANSRSREHLIRRRAAMPHYTPRLQFGLVILINQYQNKYTENTTLHSQTFIYRASRENAKSHSK